MSYEKKLSKWLKVKYQGAFVYHQWFAYDKGDGKQFAEPEFFLEFKDQVILLECKLTGSNLGRDQMLLFYKPILEFVYKKPVRCLQICKWINQTTPGPFYSSIEDFLKSPNSFGTFQWMD